MEFPLLCSPYRQRDPILPPELVDIIASFLSHDNAYRTLANLYQTCHTLRDATLKTMYETLVVDDGNFEFASALTNKRYDPPDWFEHVKLVAPIPSLSLTLTASLSRYLVCADTIATPSTLLHSRLPSLLMTTTFDQSFTSPSPGSCKIHLQKPVFSRTAFSHILTIPVRYAKYDHARCAKPSRKRSVTGFFTPCLAEMEKPLLRKIATLASLKCDDGAYIYAYPASDEWHTHIRLHSTRLPFFEPMLISNERDVDTMMELLKIPERHPRPGAVKEVDDQLWREFRDRRGNTCMGKERYDSRT
ncbi:hypothetical protein NCC49_004591 [Naganishia albida]|nr:hypothetical protein NCC49_004591 [Naganishia albida]